MWKMQFEQMCNGAQIKHIIALVYDVCDEEKLLILHKTLGFNSDLISLQHDRHCLFYYFIFLRFRKENNLSALLKNK